MLRSTLLFTLGAIASCVTPATDDDAVAFDTVSLDADLASRLFVEVDELGDPAADLDGDGLVTAAEMGLDLVQLDLAQLHAPVEVRARENDVAFGRSLVPQCFTVSQWKVWHPVDGQLCWNGSCFPLQWNVLVTVTCSSQSYCDPGPPNQLECTFVDSRGVIRTTEPPEGEPERSADAPCTPQAMCW